MLFSTRVEDYILHHENGIDSVSIGRIQGQRRLKEDYLNKRMDFDLNEGYNPDAPHGMHEKRFSLFLDWMIQKSPEGNLNKVLNGAKFVSRGEVLVRMAMGKHLANNGKGDWQIICERRNGVIFFDQRLLPQEIRRMENFTVLEKKGLYWGRRFGEYMVEETPKSTHSTLLSSLRNLSIKNESDELTTVMFSNLKMNNYGGSVKLIYSEEVNAIDSAGCHVDMKTLTDRQDGFGGYWFKKEKSLQWWLKSRLANIDYMIVGLRDDYGHVKRLVKMTPQQLENKEWDGSKFWSFLLTILMKIDRFLAEGKACKVTCISGRIDIDRITPDDAGILTERFVDHFRL